MSVLTVKFAMVSFMAHCGVHHARVIRALAREVSCTTILEQTMYGKLTDIDTASLLTSMHSVHISNPNLVSHSQLARQFHPDVNDAPDAEEKFKTISQAYEVLSNPETKARYDQFGEAGLGSGFGGGGGGGAGGFDVDLGDIFESFFGGGARAHVPAV